MRRRIGLGALGTALWILNLTLWRVAGDDLSDARWMAREGRAVLDGAPWVHPDSWSWAPVDAPFVPTSPLWQVILALVEERTDLAGIRVLSAFIIAGSLVVIAWLARQLGSPWVALAPTLVVGATVGLSFFRSRSGLPALALLLLLIALTWQLRGWMARHNVGGPLTIACLYGATASLGTWLHASWAALALASVAALAVLIALETNRFARREASLWLAGSAGALLGAASGPLGLDAWANAQRVSRACSGLVKEWRTPWALGGFWVGLWAVLAALVVISGLLAWRWADRRRPLAITLTLLDAGLVAAATTGVRFLLLALAVSMPLASWALGAGLRRLRSSRAGQALGARASVRYWEPVVLLLGLLALPFSLIAVAAMPNTTDPAFVRLPSGCHLFSDDNTGKLVVALRPDVPVWLDGRHDYYGRQRLLDAQTFLAGSGGPVVPPGTTCVLLPATSYPALQTRLDSDQDWRLISGPGALRLWLPRP